MTHALRRPELLCALVLVSAAEAGCIRPTCDLCCDGDCFEECPYGSIPGTDLCVGEMEFYCDDELDDDGDGFTDCADVECKDHGACADEVPEDCGNVVDDDGDGYIDCSDNECSPGFLDSFLLAPACDCTSAWGGGGNPWGQVCPTGEHCYCGSRTEYGAERTAGDSFECGCIRDELLVYEVGFAGTIQAGCDGGCGVRMIVHPGTAQAEAFEITETQVTNGNGEVSCGELYYAGCGVFLDVAVGDGLAMELYDLTTGSVLLHCESPFLEVNVGLPHLGCSVGAIGGMYLHLAPVPASILPLAP